MKAKVKVMHAVLLGDFVIVDRPDSRGLLHAISRVKFGEGNEIDIKAYGVEPELHIMQSRIRSGSNISFRGMLCGMHKHHMAVFARNIEMQDKGCV